MNTRWGELKDERGTKDVTHVTQYDKTQKEMVPIIRASGTARDPYRRGIAAAVLRGREYEKVQESKRRNPIQLTFEQAGITRYDSTTHEIVPVVKERPRTHDPDDDQCQAHTNLAECELKPDCQWNDRERECEHNPCGICRRSDVMRLTPCKSLRYRSSPMAKPKSSMKSRRFWSVGNE